MRGDVLKERIVMNATKRMNMTTKNELIVALVKAQQEISPPVKDKTNPMFKSKYASLDSICEAVRLPLAKNGLNLSHSVESTESKHILHTTLSHVSGEQMVTSMPMFLDKVTSQGFGSALTYAKKYAICSLLSLPSDEDDDGNAATVQQSSYSQPKVKYLTGDQIQKIILLTDGDAERIEKLKKVYEVDNLNNIPQENWEFIEHTLKKKPK